MQTFQVYKFFETINNFYFYVISHVDDENIVLTQFEHTSANKPNVSMYKYLNYVVGWDNISIEKCDTIKAVDIINNSLDSDDKCMNISTSYESFIIEKKPKRENCQKKKLLKKKNYLNKKQINDVFKLILLILNWICNK